MKYKRLEETEHKQQVREDRKQLQFKLYTESNTMEEFMMKTVLAGVKLDLLEKAAFWTYYIANNYGSNSTIRRMMVLLTLVVFTPAAFFTPAAHGTEILAKVCALGVMSAAVAGVVVGGLCCFLKSMEKQETIALRQQTFDKMSKTC